ncbi:MAG: DUF882 domain-containing protein [Desulfuromonadaceae bacterium]
MSRKVFKVFMQEKQIETRGQGHHCFSRRRFLAQGLLVAASALIVPHKQVFAATHSLLAAEKSLSFHNLHTGEDLTTTFWCRGKYQPAALEDINYILRDHRTGDIKKIDTDLLDLLHTLHTKVGAREPFHVISGYRSPQTNGMLAKTGGGVAKNSQHVLGRAIDIRLPDCELNHLRLAAVDLQGGGVGYYPDSEFIHVDVGRVRFW